MQLEAEKAEVETALEDPATYTDPGKALQLNRELSSLSDQIQTATETWEAAVTRLEGLTNPS